MSDLPTILLVEDNEDDIFLFRRAMKKTQIANPLQVVTDGEQALSYLSSKPPFNDRAVHPLPFIIFLDLKLPYIGGFEVLAWIRSRPEFSRIVVIVLTSSPEQKDFERAYSLGARSYLVKPPTAETILDIVQSLRTFWNAHELADPFRVDAPVAFNATAFLSAP